MLQTKIIDLHRAGLSHREIAVKLGISKSNVGYRLFKFVGDSKRQIITADQEQIVLGGLLGDAAICQRKRNNGGRSFVVHFGHGEKQLYYLELKHRVLHSKQKILRRERKSNDFPNSRPYYRFSFYHARYLPTIYNLCVVAGRKTVSRGWLDKLGPLGLAVWFQDDGCAKMGGTRRKDGSHKQPLVYLATNSFTATELNVIIRYFAETWQLRFLPTRVGISKHGKQIVARHKSARRFLDIVSPYMILPKYCDKVPSGWGAHWA